MFLENAVCCRKLHLCKKIWFFIWQTVLLWRKSNFLFFSLISIYGQVQNSRLASQGRSAARKTPPTPQKTLNKHKKTHTKATNYKKYFKKYLWKMKRDVYFGAPSIPNLPVRFFCWRQLLGAWGASDGWHARPGSLRSRACCSPWGQFHASPSVWHAEP